MDGRWSLFLTAGFLGGLSGCATSGNRQPAGLPIVPTTPASQLTQTSQPTASLPLTPHSGKLLPSTHLTMGAMAEQVADDPNRTAAEREQFRAKARQAYQKAIDTDAKYAPAYVALAASYAATNEREQAVANFAKATQFAPNEASVWAAQGSYFARVKEWDSAIESLSRAIQLEPTNKEHMKKLGFALARAGRVDEGYATLAKCMSEAEARYNIARMLQHLEQPMACRWYLQMALQADPNYEPAREALAAISGESSAVQPVSYSEAPPADQTAPASQATPVVQTTAPSESATPSARSAPAASQPIIVVNGTSTAAPTTTTSSPSTTQPVTIVNRQSPATAPATVAAPNTAAPASSGDLPRLPPVILGSRDAPTAPMKAGVEGIVP